MESTEATIYRYFESKHKLLGYLISWYWNWQDYRLVYETSNFSAPADRLTIAMRILSGRIPYENNFSHIDEAALQKIVIAGSAKSFLTKVVDTDNSYGFFIATSACAAVLLLLLKRLTRPINTPSRWFLPLPEVPITRSFFLSICLP